MPYGFPIKLGGDNPANDQKMERCVTQLMAKGQDKVSAIRICKVAIARAEAHKR